MRKIKIIIFWFIVLNISCNSKEEEVELNDSSRIERITDPWEVDVFYRDSIFYLNKDLRALIQGYKDDTLLFETFNTKIIYNGRSMMGNGALSKRIVPSKEGLTVIQTFPHQITKVDFRGKITDPIPLRLKNTIQVLDGFFLSDASVGLVTYPSLEQPNRLELISYNFNEKDVSLLFKKESNYPANTNLVRANSSFIFVLNPYEKNLTIIDKNGNLVDDIKFPNAKIFLDFKPPYPFSTPDEYFALSPVEQLASRSDNVYDFYYNQHNLFLLVRRLFLNEEKNVSSRSEFIKISLQTGHVSAYSDSGIFLSFDQKGNIFRYKKDQDFYFIDVLPISDFNFESN
jgi:hypothetical protein